MNLNARFNLSKNSFRSTWKLVPLCFCLQSYNSEKPKTILLTSVDKTLTFH